jgi:hypothetical protein
MVRILDLVKWVFRKSSMHGHSFHDALFEVCSNHCHKPAQLTPSPKKQTTSLHSTAQAQLSSLPTVYQGHCQHLPADKKLQLLSALLSTIGVCAFNKHVK